MTRIKLFLLLTLTTLLLLVRHPLWLFIFLLFVLLGSLLTIPFRKLKSRLQPLLIIALFIILFQLIFRQSVPLNERLLSSLSASAKILALSLSVLYFTSITSPGSLVEALSFLPESARLALTITFSLIPSVIEEGKQISLLQATRGYKSSFWQPLAGITPIIIPLIHRVLNRAEKITLALYTKGYGQ